MKNILIDSDVILDFFLHRQPFSDDAAYIFSDIELGKVNGFITPVIISNVYYLLRKFSSHNKVVKKLSQFMLLVDILHIDKQIIISALNSTFKDFEDALQNFASEQNGNIDTIITRNLKDYKKSNIAVLNPVQYKNAKNWQALLTSSYLVSAILLEFTQHMH